MLLVAGVALTDERGQQFLRACVLYGYVCKTMLTLGKEEIIYFVI